MYNGVLKSLCTYYYNFTCTHKVAFVYFLNWVCSVFPFWFQTTILWKSQSPEAGWGPVEKGGRAWGAGTGSEGGDSRMSSRHSYSARTSAEAGGRPHSKLPFWGMVSVGNQYCYLIPRVLKGRRQSCHPVPRIHEYRAPCLYPHLTLVQNCVKWLKVSSLTFTEHQRSPEKQRNKGGPEPRLWFLLKVFPGVSSIFAECCRKISYLTPWEPVNQRFWFIKSAKGRGKG